MGFVATVEPVFFPLDEELGLLPGSVTPTVHEWLVRLGTWLPFAVAAQLLGDFAQITVSEADVRRKTERAGEVGVQLQGEEVVALEEGHLHAMPGPERMVMTVDGAMVPLVKGEWAEVKTLSLGVPEEQRAIDGKATVHTQQLSYFSRLADADSFTHDALVETERRGLSTAEKVVAVSDGAEWIQGTVDFHRPDALRILDFPHAAEHIAQVQHILKERGLCPTDSWLTDELHRLKHEGPAALLDQLRLWRQTYPDLPLADPVNYLAKREKLMDYPAFQAAGWPIGSGSGESANKLVVEARLKGAGMHWQRAHVNPMLALRNLVCNDRWQEAWPLIAARLRQDDCQRRLLKQQQRHALKTPPLPTPLPPISQAAIKVASSGQTTPLPAEKKSARPAANHPWRRSPIGRTRGRSSSTTSLAKN